MWYFISVFLGLFLCIYVYMCLCVYSVWHIRSCRMDYKVIPLKQCPDDSLLYITFRSDVDAIVDELVVREPLITTSKMEQVRKLILSIFSDTSQIVLTV